MFAQSTGILRHYTRNLHESPTTSTSNCRRQGNSPSRAGDWGDAPVSIGILPMSTVLGSCDAVNALRTRISPLAPRPNFFLVFGRALCYAHLLPLCITLFENLHNPAGHFAPTSCNNRTKCPELCALAAT